MPDVSSIPYAPHYELPPNTKEQLDYADLVVIDLSKMNTPEGVAELTTQARDAMRDVGFFYVINHGLTLDQTQRMVDIADLAFTRVSDDEKQKFDGKMQTTGSYQGYKLRQFWHIENGIRDQIEHYNINKDITRKDHPAALKPFLPEIDQFIRYNHLNILHPILRLLARGLELPEDTFVKQHAFDSTAETWLRFMKYFPRSMEEEMQTRNVWLKGHTDFTSVSILWSQPVSGLQIKSPDAKWRWIRHISNALVINLGDSMEFLSGGYYKATIHRVVQPPIDQRGLARLGLFYFTLPNDDVRLIPVSGSPVLERHGIKRAIEDDKAPTAESFRKGRIATYGNVTLNKGPEKDTEVQYVDGIMVRHYN